MINLNQSTANSIERPLKKHRRKRRAKCLKNSQGSYLPPVIPAKADKKLEEPTWTIVENKERLEKRPDDPITTSKSELSYSEILCTVAKGSYLKDLGQSLTGIRRTKKGEWMFSIKKQCAKSRSKSK